MPKTEHIATAAIIAAAARIKLRQVVIKDNVAFQRAHESLQAALSRSWDMQVRAAITSALERLAQLGEGLNSSIEI
jgi:hypothetical protein